MIVAIPLDEDRRTVCPSFGRCPYFLFSDTETGEERVEENPAAQAQGGAGLKAAQCVVDGEAEILVTVRCGENAAKVLQAAGVAIYRAEGTGAGENLEALRADRLEVMTRFHPGFVGGQP